MWALLEPVFRAGETFPHDPSITETEARALWVEQAYRADEAAARQQQAIPLADGDDYGDEFGDGEVPF